MEKRNPKLFNKVERQCQSTKRGQIVRTKADREEAHFCGRRRKALKRFRAFVAAVKEYHNKRYYCFHYITFYFQPIFYYGGFWAPVCIQIFSLFKMLAFKVSTY